MYSIEFTCRTCGKVYGDEPTHGFELANEFAFVTLKNVTSQCPRCNRFNPPTLGDGTYAVRGGRATLINSLVREVIHTFQTRDDIVALKDQIADLADRQDAHEALASLAIEKGFASISAQVEAISRRVDAQGEQLSALDKQVAAQTRKAQIQFLIEMLVAALSIVISLWPEGKEQEVVYTPAQIDRIIERTIEEMEEDQPSLPVIEHPDATPSRQPTTAAEPTRSAPCPCGSGLKYKRCHGPLHAPR